MALILFGVTTCSLCGQVLVEDSPFVAFPHFLGGHRLSSHSDSGMHAACYEAWPDRAEFDALYEKHRSAFYAEAEKLREAERAKRKAIDPTVAAAHRELMATVHSQGATCPRCGVHAFDYREFSTTVPTRVLCPSCKRACDPFDLIVADKRDGC